MTEKTVLYFGCIDEKGHYLHTPRERLYDRPPRFPWTYALMDTGLLKNGKHPDVYDGKVFWTCGGSPLWLAFVWWDNSVDRRGGSNSGFYVQGFTSTEREAALIYAGMVFPKVVARQRQPLVLQS